MKHVFAMIALILVGPCACYAQASGNAAYGQPGGRAKAEQNELNKRNNYSDVPPTPTSTFIDANVLLNMKADEYVAVFGVSQDGATLSECSQKMAAVINQFTAAIRQLGISPNDLFVDFVAQNRVYSYKVTGDLAKESLSGFELKKNVSVHYTNYSMLDRLVVAAANLQIFDLIKVDYIVDDTAAVQSRLFNEAAQVIRQKAASYQRLFGIKLHAAQVYAQKPSIYYPTEMYDSYTAFESDDVNPNYYGQKYIVQNARKSRTFFFNGLTANGYDLVVNPVIVQPVVQFTLYLKMRYTADQGKPAGPHIAKTQNLRSIRH